jgi:hypothetical protein
MAYDYYATEYGSTLVVTMPFDASIESQTIAIVMKKPNGSEVTWTTGITATATSVSRTFAVGELDVVGVWSGEVRVTRPSPARLRIVRFDFHVG